MMKSISVFTLLLLSCFLLTFVSARTADQVAGICECAECQFHQCRFWGIVSHSLPEAIVLEHLLNSTYSLKNLGASNQDGWGLAYYNGSEPVVLRGELSANMDGNFDVAAEGLAKSGAHVGVGHVRAAASGASGIPNPHPFIRLKGEKWWAFGHNGVLSKSGLKALIGVEYLQANPPSVGNDWNDPAVVDSDLYMLYVLKCVEENGWNVTSGVAEAVKNIAAGDSGSMNFFLTDGEALWGFRKGNTLYYYYNETSPQFSEIASQPPTINQEDWTELNDYELVKLTINSRPEVVADITAVPEFPSSLVLACFLIAAFTAAAIHKFGGHAKKGRVIV